MTAAKALVEIRKIIIVMYMFINLLHKRRGTVTVEK